jgi:lipoate-protein ligase A
MLYFETGSTDPAYNLAFEEYVLTHRTVGDILILWQNDNAVIIGRNQNTAEEINQSFVDAHGIHVVRRNTGGGAVYHDLGNLNYSFITDEGASRNAFTQPVVRALCALGMDAEASGRNDILVSGKKVSGTAQQISKGRILHHGTLLFDSDSSMISGALTPDPGKYQSKGVKSVRSRVGNIRAFLQQDMTITAFWAHLKRTLGDAGMVEAQLTAEELAQVEKLKAEKYDTWQWNYGRSPAYDTQVKRRFTGGTLDVRLTVKQGVIAQIKFYGDFLAVSPVHILEEALLGCEYRREAIQQTLSGLPVEACLGGITAEECMQTILNI